MMGASGVCGAGLYEIQLLEAEEEVHIADHAVRVSRYELPIRVTASPDEGAYVMTTRNDSANVTIHADYLFGEPVKHAGGADSAWRHGVPPIALTRRWRSLEEPPVVEGKR